MTTHPAPYQMAAAAAGSLGTFAGPASLEARAHTGVGTVGTTDYESYYGPAPAGVMNADVHGQVARTNLQLPAYYQGKNLYLERIISWGVADLEDWPTTAFLPLMPYDGMHFTWSKMQNTPHILDRVPEEAASRLVTTTFELQTASTERYGLAFRMEHGLMGTPLGEKMWTSNIKQIVQATLRSINLAIINLAVAQETHFQALADTRLRMLPSSVRIRQVMDAEARFFGAVQKPYGMETLIGNMNSVFLDRGIDANMAICPADVSALLRCRQETRDFMLNGALAQLYQIDPTRSLPCYVYNKRIALFEHRGVFADQSEVRANPLIRQRSIGSYFTMKSNHQKDKKAKAGTRDIRVIDHNRQTWKTIRYIEALENSGLFDDTPEGRLTQLGREVLFPKQPLDEGPDYYTFDKLLQQYDEAIEQQSKFGERLRYDLPNTDLTQPQVDQLNGLLKDKNNKLVEKIVKFIISKQTLSDFSKTPTTDAHKRLLAILGAKNQDALLEQIRGAYLPEKNEIKYTLRDATSGEGAEVTLQECRKMLKGHKPVPINLYIMRPHQTFRMGAMVMGRGGEETGFTVFGNANFQLADEATTKTAIGHYTCYFKPVVHTPKNLQVAPDAVFQGYLGGAGTKFFNGYTQYHPQQHIADVCQMSDLVVMAAALDDPMDGVQPLTGSWDDLSALKPLRECTSDTTEMMERVGNAYNRHRQSAFSMWANEPLIGDGEDSMESQRYSYFDRFHGLNVLCYQGRQMSYDPVTTGLTKETEARGHLRGLEFVDSSIKEWSGHVAFRDSVVDVRARSE